MIARAAIILILSLAIGLERPQTAVYRNVSSKPDFSGVWNARISQAPESMSLKISYQSPKLKISRTTRSSTPVMVLGQLIPSGFTVDFVYYTDGRGETNVSLFQLGPITSGGVKSKTEQVGQKFLISSSFTAKQSGRQVNQDITYALEVSSDGRTLTLTTTIISDGVKQQVAESYDRIEGNKSNDISGRWTKKLNESIVSLIVSHSDPEIKVTRRVLSQAGEQVEGFTYYTDGRGESNVEQGKAVKSTTRWNGNSVEFEIASLARVGDDNISVSKSVKWQLSNDGKTLSETTRIRTGTTVGMVTPDSQETKLNFARSSNELPKSIR